MPIESAVSSRECVSLALGHRPSSRIPIDLGGTAVTGIHITCVAALHDYYGLDVQMVRDQVLSRCEIFARSGGFVFNTVHNIQCGTPVENIAAMIDAVRQFQGS